MPATRLFSSRAAATAALALVVSACSGGETATAPTATVAVTPQQVLATYEQTMARLPLPMQGRTFHAMLRERRTGMKPTADGQTLLHGSSTIAAELLPGIFAYGVNDAGTISGNRDNTTFAPLAFRLDPIVLRNGVETTLESPLPNEQLPDGTPYRWAAAQRINVQNVAVGSADRFVAAIGELLPVPVQWEANGRARLLPTTGSGFGIAFDIDVTGTAVGTEFGAGTLPLVWRNGQVSVLPTGGVGGAAYAIEGRFVAGSVDGPDGAPQAARWVNGRLERITVPGAVFSQANAVNARGDVAGEYLDGATGCTRPFQTLNGRVIVLPTVFCTTFASGIANDGTVIGSEIDDDPNAYNTYALRWVGQARERLPVEDTGFGVNAFAGDIAEGAGGIVGLTFDMATGMVNSTRWTVRQSSR